MTANDLIALVALIVGLAGAAGYALRAVGRPAPWMGKLEPMRERFGRGPGTALHFTAYVVLPLVVAAVLALAAG